MGNNETDEVRKKYSSLYTEYTPKTSCCGFACLQNILPPPSYYTCDLVASPEYPRQYLRWKFHGFNLLVASDAIIVTQNKEGVYIPSSSSEKKNNKKSNEQIALAMNNNLSRLLGNQSKSCNIGESNNRELTVRFA